MSNPFLPHNSSINSLHVWYSSHIEPWEIFLNVSIRLKHFKINLRSYLISHLKAIAVSVVVTLQPSITFSRAERTARLWLVSSAQYEALWLAKRLSSPARPTLACLSHLSDWLRVICVPSDPGQINLPQYQMIYNYLYRGHTWVPELGKQFELIVDVRTPPPGALGLPPSGVKP